MFIQFIINLMKHYLLLILFILSVIPFIYAKGNIRDEEPDTFSHEKFFSSTLAIFFSGLGDKSFLITAFMAMKYNKVLVFISGFLALTLMGIISIQFGKLVSIYINQVYLNIFGGLLFILMGLYFIFIPIESEDKNDAKRNEEMEDIRLLVNSNNTRIKNNVLNPFIQSFSLIFFSELGDKSQIAAIYISTNSGVLMAFTAITIANALLTILGIFAGELVKDKLSKKTLSVISGVLFIIFGFIFIQAVVFDEETAGIPEVILTNRNSQSTLLKQSPRI